MLFDSLTLWVSARMLEGVGEATMLLEFDRFLRGAAELATVAGLEALAEGASAGPQVAGAA